MTDNWGKSSAVKVSLKRDSLFLKSKGSNISEIKGVSILLNCSECWDISDKSLWELPALSKLAGDNKGISDELQWSFKILSNSWSRLSKSNTSDVSIIGKISDSLVLAQSIGCNLLSSTFDRSEQICASFLCTVCSCFNAELLKRATGLLSGLTVRSTLIIWDRGCLISFVDGMEPLNWTLNVGFSLFMELEHESCSTGFE